MKYLKYLKYLTLLSVLGAAFVLGVGSSPAAGPDPLTCAGYPEPRVFLETQSWWLQTPGRNGTDFGHVHLGTCFPQGQAVRGVVTLDVRVMLHENPGTLSRVSGGLVSSAGQHHGWDVPVGLKCSGTCEKWIKVTVDTRVVPVDGRVEWRFRPRVAEPDGKQMAPSTGWQTYLDNGGGRPVTEYRHNDSAIARGWYTGVGYANSSVKEMPTGPVSGVWTPTVSMDAGAGGGRVTYHLATIDPNFHLGDRGIVVKEGSGPFKGKLTIDTRRLSDGPHRLVLKADSDVSSGSTNSGVLVVRFVVANGGSSQLDATPSAPITEPLAPTAKSAPAGSTPQAGSEPRRQHEQGDRHRRRREKPASGDAKPGEKQHGHRGKERHRRPGHDQEPAPAPTAPQAAAPQGADPAEAATASPQPPTPEAQAPAPAAQPSPPPPPPPPTEEEFKWEGNIISLSASAITIKRNNGETPTCAIGEGSPSVSKFELRERVKICCKHSGDQFVLVWIDDV